MIFLIILDIPHHWHQESICLLTVQNMNNKSASGDGRRKFHEFPKFSEKPPKETTLEEATSLLKFIADDIIGKDFTFDSPFGRRSITYCDYVASGRGLHSIEKYLQEVILPAYGNTHTTISATSLRSTEFLHEAR